MLRLPLALDTSAEIEDRQVEACRRMCPAEKAAIVTNLAQAAYALTCAGVRHRYPQASAREQFLRVALIVLGAELACHMRHLPLPRRWFEPVSAPDPVRPARP